MNSGVGSTLAGMIGFVIVLTTYPHALPGWVGFLILCLGGCLLIGQAVGRVADEFARQRLPRPDGTPVPGPN